MKKIATYYLIVIALLNAFFAWVLTQMAGVMRKALSGVLEGASLPVWTARALAFPWWPCIVTGVCVGAVLVSIFTRVQSRQINHAVIIILVVDLWFMFATAVAYVIPWVTLDVAMSG